MCGNCALQSIAWKMRLKAPAGPDSKERRINVRIPHPRRPPVPCFRFRSNHDCSANYCKHRSCMPLIELLDQSSKTSLRSTQLTNPTESTDQLYETNPIRLRHLLPRCPDPRHGIDGQRCQKESIPFSGRRYL